MTKVNAHLHTPYSFSAFSSVEEALDRALAENVRVVGVNDFYTTEAYDAWNLGCQSRNLYPLFNIELIALDEGFQQKGLRVNDPGNPGRIYISGKGLSYPFNLKDPYASQLNLVIQKSNEQVEAMCSKLNKLLESLNIGFNLDVDWIKSMLTMGLFRERHLAKALRIKAYEFFSFEGDIKFFFEKVFGGKPLNAKLENHAAVENEIRANLLKAGGAAFVPETPDAFLSVETVQNVILAAGGIPTYPFLADDVEGKYTDFEVDLERVATDLKNMGFFSVEFISTRNDVKLLEKYASYLYDRGFVVTFGSEHNTPTMEPVELFARHATVLTEKLQGINYEGACVIAAHQHMRSKGLNGYVNEKGQVALNEREDFVAVGDKLIQMKINKNN